MTSHIPPQRYIVVPLRDGRYGLFDRQLNGGQYVKYGTEQELRKLRLRLSIELRDPIANRKAS